MWCCSTAAAMETIRPWISLESHAHKNLVFPSQHLHFEDDMQHSAGTRTHSSMNISNGSPKNIDAPQLRKGRSVVEKTVYRMLARMVEVVGI